MHLLLVLMVVIWGANYSLIKVVLRELPPPVFNALRLLIASGVFLILLALTARTRPTRREWIQLAGLGLYGQCLYQLFFLNGMSRTSVANASSSSTNRSRSPRDKPEAGSSSIIRFGLVTIAMPTSS